MTFVVRYLDVKAEYKAKSFVDAARKSLIDRSGKTPFTVSCVMEVYRKSNPKKRTIFNTYFVLKSAGMPVNAELLRTRFQQEYDIDLAREPIRNTIR